MIAFARIPANYWESQPLGVLGSMDDPSLTLLASLPIATSWWFVPTTIVFAALSVRQLFQIRERNRKKLQDELQSSLEEKAVELDVKCAEIEHKQRNIEQNLDYAKHIQAAILPEDEKLRTLFPHSFIFNQPRDTVSGDFYWFKRFEQKFVIACADATGQGIPGAFMSMIGSILLRDLSTMNEIDSPDKLLEVLDKEVRRSLKNQPNSLTSDDGMDISVCEIDIETRVIRTASAMHSIFICRNNKLERVKGDRHSIGGIKPDLGSTNFSLQEHKLQPGDKIYLFSDGLPNQFGGMTGKKLKLKGTKELLESIMDRPMEEQADLLRNKFRSWMNDHEQVDDILFIGLQV